MAGAAILALSVLAPWRDPVDGPAGLLRLGHPGLLALAALLAALLVPLRRADVSSAPGLTAATGALAAIGTLIVERSSSDPLPFLSTGRALGLLGAAALVGSAVGLPGEVDVPTLGFPRDAVEEPLTDAESAAFTARLRQHLVRPSSPRGDLLALASVVATGVGVLLLFAPWRARVVPRPGGSLDGPTTVASGTSLLGPGRTAIVVGLVVLGWLVAAAFGARRALPALVLGGRRAARGPPARDPPRPGVGHRHAGPGGRGRRRGRRRRAGCHDLVAHLGPCPQRGGPGPPGGGGRRRGAPAPGRDGPFTVLADGTEVAVDGAPARSVGFNTLVAWWDGERPGAISSPAVDPDDGADQRDLAWSIDDGRVRARFSVGTGDTPISQVVGRWVVAQGSGRASVYDLRDELGQGCCADGFAADRKGHVWRFQPHSGSGTYERVPASRIGDVGDGDGELPTPAGAQAIVAGDDGPLFVVEGTRLVDPVAGRMVFDARGPCGTPGGGLAPNTLGSIGPVAGDGRGGLWLVAQAGGSLGGVQSGDVLVHLDAKGKVERLAHRVEDVSSLAVSDRGRLLLAAGGRLLELDDPIARLTSLGSLADCAEPGPRVAPALRTTEAPALAEEQDQFGSGLPLPLDAKGTTFGYAEDGYQINRPVGDPVPIALPGDLTVAVGDGEGGAWALTDDGWVGHVHQNGRVDRVADVPEDATWLGATSAGQPPTILGGSPDDVLDRATVGGQPLPAAVSPNTAPSTVVRTRSGALLVVADGQVLRQEGDRWVRIAGQKATGGNESVRATVDELLAGDAQADDVYVRPTSDVVPDVVGDGALFVSGDLLVRVDVDGSVTALAQDERLRGADLARVGDQVVVDDAFGQVGLLAERSAS
ncbi:hypothetical protein KSP35_05875 [Aquihabitans sp. G128]|uniref:hypothetical protein n=1 Tax=Aquihabitans sp. G128 TaxID=2849779 RepID=UPI001C213585|nr:hypothetical protein [Aquihabitans sp. G128]QXC62333.1 hypothetical protein KSP35_05875 [Aquihabitans sp. G128]